MSEQITKPEICKNTTYGRVYLLPPTIDKPNGEYVGSVTTIISGGMPISPWLDRYRIETSGGSWENLMTINGVASEIGTVAHSIFIDRVLQGEEVTISDDPKAYLSGDGYYPTPAHVTQLKKAVQSGMAFWMEQKPELIATEELVWSTETAADGSLLCPWAGRIDIVCVIDGETWLLDYKTAKQVTNNLQYQAQLTAYKMCWDHMHPEQKIDRLGIIHGNKMFKRANPPPRVLQPIEYPFTPETMYHAYYFFQENYDGFELGAPKKSIPTPSTFSLAESNDT